MDRSTEFERPGDVSADVDIKREFVISDSQRCHLRSTSVARDPRDERPDYI